MNRVKVIKGNFFLLIYILSVFAYINVRILDLSDYMLMCKTLMYSFLFCWYVVRANTINSFFVFVLSLFVASDLLYVYYNYEIKYVLTSTFIANISLVYFIGNKIKNHVEQSVNTLKVLKIITLVLSVAYGISLFISGYTAVLVVFIISLLLLFYMALQYYKKEVKESSFLILASICTLIISMAFEVLNKVVIEYTYYTIIHAITYALFLFLITKSILLEDEYDINITREEKFFLNRHLSIILFVVFSIIYTYLRVIDNTDFVMYITKTFLIVVMFLYYINLRTVGYNQFFLMLSVLHLVGGNVFVSTDEASFVQGVGFYFLVNIILIIMLIKKIGAITFKDIVYYLLPSLLIAAVFIYYVFSDVELQFLIITFSTTLSILVATSVKYFYTNSNRTSFFLFFSIQTMVACYIFAAYVRLVQPSLLFNFFEAILYCLELYFLTEFFIAKNREFSSEKTLRN